MNDHVASKHAPELPAWKAFVVQFSREDDGFSGRVEHLSSGRRLRFSSSEELLSALAKLLEGLKAESNLVESSEE